jgi:DNA-binding CsgD family transcriptional regulator
VSTEAGQFHVQPRLRLAGMVLLERDSELAAAGAAVERGSVLVIEGGAGIGKTSLLDAACARAAEARCDVLRARGSELESAFSFGVVRQLFERRLADAEAGEREELLAGPAAAAWPLLSGELGELATEDTSFAVLHGLYWLAVNLAAGQRLVIAVDDAHWADGPSLRSLAYLAPRVEGLALSLLVALRPGEPESAEAPLLALHAAAATMLRPRLLSLGAVSTIVRGRLGGEASDELCAAVARASGGNPFYVRELLRAAELDSDRQAGLDAAELLARGREGLAPRVAARVRRLDPRALRCAQALAVLGDGCEPRHAAAVAGLEIDAAVRLAAGLVRLEVLAEDSPPRFLHPILREAVEASMESDERDFAHRAAAGCLHADRAPPGKVAAHLVGVRPAGDAWVLARLREAARAAIERGAPGAGAELLARALAEPPPPGERVAVLREAGRADALAGRETACARLEEALELVDDPRERAEIALELAEAHATQFRWAEAVDVCERALAEVGETDEALTARLEAELVVAGLRDARRASPALAVLERLSARRLEGSLAEACAVGRGVAALWFAGRPAAEVALPLQLAFERAGPLACNWDLRAPGLWALIHAGGFDAAEETLESMRAEVQRTGGARGFFVTYVTLALLNLRLGALPEADVAARVGLDVVEAADFVRGLAFAATVLAEISIEAGELGEAQALLERLPRAGWPATLATVLIPAARGRLALAQDRPADALDEFETCLRLLSAAVWGMQIHDRGHLHVRSGAALALLRLGERERARELADTELGEARAFGAPRALGIALRVAGLTRAGEPGLDLLGESVAVLRSSPALLERARSLAELGAALRRAGRRAAAREPLSEALDLAARCGARPLAAHAREELKATGARPRREWRIGVEALTPSELRVARLAAEGKTNREIALALYVTPKTVERHLARAYSKLDIARRGELPVALEGRGGAEKIRVATP